VVQEALRAGRPLVATRAGGIADLTGEDAALLVPAGDAGALARAVLSVLDDASLVARLRAAATQRSTALPGAGDAVDSAVALYRRVLRARTGQEILNRLSLAETNAKLGFGCEAPCSATQHAVSQEQCAIPLEIEDSGVIGYVPAVTS
jgi:hypothetical protein